MACNSIPTVTFVYSCSDKGISLSPRGVDNDVGVDKWRGSMGEGSVLFWRAGASEENNATLTIVPEHVSAHMV